MTEQWLTDTPSVAVTNGSTPTMVDDLERRSNLFLERCKEEWLGLHMIGMLLFGYARLEP